MRQSKSVTGWTTEILCRNHLLRHGRMSLGCLALFSLAHCFILC